MKNIASQFVAILIIAQIFISVNAYAQPTPGTGVQVLLKGKPLITWTATTPIYYLQPIDATQFVGQTANVPGTFNNLADMGKYLTVGIHYIHSTFTPTDTFHYRIVFDSILINVKKANPVITWANPSDVAFGTTLSATQLNATANVPGTFVYSPNTGASLNGGANTLSVTFTPTDAINYAAVTATATVNVTQFPPVINWSTPIDIVYGTALSATQLNATSVAGTFVYTPPLGTVLNAGAGQTLSVSFTPTNSSMYTTATASVLINVTKATPTISWTNPVDIVYGTALSATQLAATSTTPGTFVYTPATGIVLNAGQNQTLSVAFTPTNTSNYNNTSVTASINVTQATPVITWTNPADINYGTALSATQLNATANVPGTFVYSPPLTTILNAGNGQTISVTFTPTDAINYKTTTGTALINVKQATPVLTWANPADIVYGTALSATQLNATANVPGMFVYSPPLTTILNAGNGETLTVTFTPTDAVNYKTTIVTAALNVLKATPTITWANPADINYGTALSATQLNATANVPGMFVYTPSLTTVLNAGNAQTLSVSFTPTDAVNYKTTTAIATLNVLKATPTITWANPADIVYGTALSATQLNATANVPGTFVYSPPLTTILNAGNNQTLSVIFTPTDAVNYKITTVTAVINVLQATPTITWTNPADIVFGTALSATQLNATANVPGTFVYSPPLTTVMNAGNGQTLSVTFTPTDAINYKVITGAVLINVKQATPVVTWANPANIFYGTALSATQLNATANVPGTFVYSPPLTTILNTGNGQTLSATFTPTDAVNYKSITATATINVLKATPIITWANPANITYGTALSATQLNATANVPGTFVYTPGLGTVLNVATSQTLSVVFTPSDAVNYNTVTASVTIKVAKATPVINWSNPANITYGTALSATQLNATSIPGSFVYSPNFGTILNAGVGQTLTVTFSPNNSTDYKTTTATVLITVLKATPTINWSNPADIVYGTLISSTQLNATASKPGSFVYSPALNTLLTAGIQTLSVTFTPTDVVDYNTATASVLLNVAKATPTATWSNPANIIYGTALSATQLNATSSVPGIFVYTPPLATVLNAGSGQTLSATFTPTDALDYKSITVTAAINVLKANPTITWANPANIVYGTALSATQLNATASVPGTFTYSPNLGAVLNSGTGQRLSVTFTPTNLNNYNTVTATSTINVLKATPVINWSNPANITYGTALSSTQLNATSVAGSFVYSPGIGTVLNTGAAQTLSVTFTPTNGTNYTTATASVSINVTKAVLNVIADNVSKIYLDPVPPLTYHFSGLINGDLPTVITGAPILTTSVVQSSPYGLYPIIATQGNLAAANYTFNIVNGTFSVRKSLTTWNGTVWDNGAPDAAVNATLAGSYVVGVLPNIICKTLTLQAGYNLEIDAGYYVTVNADFINNGTVLLKSAAGTAPTGSLIISGNVTGNVSVQLWLSGNTTHYMSAPVANATTSVFTGLPTVKSYIASTGLWNPATGNYVGALTQGKGYSVSYAVPVTLTFKGLPKSGSFDFYNGLLYNVASVTDNGGNPFTSAIDWYAMYNLSTTKNISPIISYRITNSQFATYSAATGAATNGGQRYLPAMQGFCVRPTNSGAVLTATNAVKVHASAVNYMKNTEIIDNSLKLKATGDNVTGDETMILFRDDATTGFDDMYDGEKLFVPEPEFCHLYSRATDGYNLAINTLPEAKAVNLFFRAGVSGMFNIDLANINLNNISTVYLEDLATGTITNLSTGAYSFKYEAINSDKTFVLHFGMPTAVNKVTPEVIATVYSNNHSVYVLSNKIGGNIIIYNLQGTVIANRNITSDITRVDMNVASGIYLVKIIENNKVITQKVLIE